MRSLRQLLGLTEAAPEVVRPRIAIVRRLLWGAGLLIGVFALYVAYEFGRYDGGYDRQAAAQERTELEVKIDRLEQSNREMRTQVAEGETIRLGRAHEQAEVSRAIEDLQAQLARQSQQLNFYRGLVAQNTATMGVKVDQLHISPGTKANAFLVKFALLRSGRADADATGTVHLTLDGSSSEGPKSLELPYLTGGRVRELHFSFRYLQSLQQEIVLPAGFAPEQLSVELVSVKRDVPPSSQNFPWNVESNP